MMKSFIELAENSPKVLRPFVPQCFDLMLKARTSIPIYLY